MDSPHRPPSVRMCLASIRGATLIVDGISGHVIDVQIVKDRQTGQPRGFAFVKFSNQRDANAAVAKAPHILNGRTINVAASNLARGGGEAVVPATAVAPPVVGAGAVAAPAREDALLGPMPVRVKAEASDQKPYHRRDSDVGRGGRSLSPELDKYLDGGRGKRGGDTTFSGSSKRSRFSDDGPPKTDAGDKVAIIVDNLFNGTAKLDEYATKVQADTRETCAAFGEVLSIEIPVQSIEAAQPVFVEFFQAAHAAAAAENIASRTYDGRQLVVRRVTRRELRSEIDRRPSGASSSGGKRRGSAAEKELEEEVDDLRRQLQRARNELKDAGDKKDAEKARLRADLAHHSAQHKLLQTRVDELEDELDKARISARKDREFHAARVKALADRAHTLEADRETL
mmetsp:Transcript_26157/g.104641  ORF Transcript_26157/g.104641 Transcript_26157/m.104641 type:complete len:399 (+) Transcript_26157:568-1764(+)